MPSSSQYHQLDYEFANTFVTLRTTIGLTQQGLAQHLGISSKAVANWEQGLTRPKAEHLKAFLKLCVGHAAFAAGREEEQIRAFWKAARQRVLLDEQWLQELLAQPSPSLAKGAGVPSPGSEQGSLASSEALTLWTVPYARNPHFTGGEELLSHLEQQFARRAADQPTTLHQAALTQSQAIKGLGGIGKTQIAIEYAYRAREQGRYTHTLWISAASEEAVLSSFAALADRVPALFQEEESDQRTLVKKALRWLEQRPEPWLLIYDNADDITFLPAYLPIQGQGSILFTTRASAVRALAPSLEVEALPLEEGVKLLLRRAAREDEVTEREREEASAIVLALDRFPLAIDQAGAYLEETGCSLADYLQIYQQHQYQLLARRGKQVSGYPDSVATTWSLAFERIEQSDPAAAELLRLCAFVAPDQIPEELLIEGAPYWPAALQEAAKDRFRFNQMLSTLLSFSLIKRVGRERMLSLHRLVQVVQLERMTREEQRQWAERLVRAVQAVFPQDPEEVASWPGCQRYLDQAQVCETLIQQYHLLLPEAANLLDRTGTYLIERALYSVAEPLLRRALDMREQLLGSEHPDVATSLHHLARLSWILKEYAQAEVLHQRALGIREKYLGDAHPDVAESLNELALIHDECGNYTQAEPLFQRALRLYEQALGPEHPDVARVLNNLAVHYSVQGQYAQAEPLYQQALRILEQQREPEQPDVARALNNLAHLYMELRKYEQAEPLYQQALRLYEQGLGPKHPLLAFTLDLLAHLYSMQDRFPDAEGLYLRALRIREQFGPEYRDLSPSLRGLANLYTQYGMYTQAEPLYLRALHICEQQIGPKHPETARVLDAFAGFQQVQGNILEAAALYERALAIRETVLGPEHPQTVETRTRLKAVLGAMGKMPALVVNVYQDKGDDVPIDGAASTGPVGGR